VVALRFVGTIDLLPYCLLSLKLLKVVKKRLLNFLLKYNLLYKHQYGFRPKSGLANTIFGLVNDIQTALDSGRISAGVFLDISKAFDTVDHNILLEKLQKYGIRGIPLQWFSSYLSERTQFVSVGDFDSRLLPVTHGVPQGSVSGPILFSLFVNDFGKLPLNGKAILYADDTNIFYQGASSDLISDKIQEDLLCIQEWFLNNRLVLNADKCSMMWFSKPGHTVNVTFLPMLNGKKLEVINQSKFLGVTLESHLGWSAHINKTIAKVIPFIKVFARCQHLLSDNDKRTLYFSLIHPHVSFLCNVWGIVLPNTWKDSPLFINEFLKHYLISPCKLALLNSSSLSQYCR